MPKASIKIDMPGRADIVTSSLKPEVQVARASVHLSHTQDSLIMEIDATDSVSLRAACNSFLRWVEVALQMQDLVGQCE